MNLEAWWSATAKMLLAKLAYWVNCFECVNCQNFAILLLDHAHAKGTVLLDCLEYYFIESDNVVWYNWLNANFLRSTATAACISTRS